MEGSAAAVSSRAAIARRAGMLSLSNWAIALSGAARAILAGRILGPTNWGTWSFVMLVVGYGLWADAGMVTALNREVPSARMKGESEVSRIATAAFVAKVVSLAAVMLVLLGVRAFAGGEWLSPVALAGIFFVLLASAADTFLTGMALGRERHGAVAAHNWVMVAMGLLLPVGGAYAYGLVGFLVGYVVALALSVASVARAGWARWDGYGMRAEVVRLARIGWPLMVLGLMGSTVVRVDQWVIMAWLDRTALGLYAMALAAGALLCTIPAATSQVTLPHLVRRAEAGEARATADLTGRSMLLVGAAVAAAVVIGWWISAPLIRTLLPAYAPVIGPARVYLVATFFLATDLGAGNGLLAMNRHGLNILPALGAAVLNLAVDFVLVYRLHLGLMGVAFGSLVTYILYASLHSVMLAKVIDPASRRPFRFLPSFAPGLALLVLVPFATHVRPTPGALAATVVAAGAAIWSARSGWTGDGRDVTR